MKMIKVLIVDDSSFMRKLLRDILEANPDIKIVGMAKNGEEAIEMNETLNPDVITMDVEMPVMNGIEAVEKIMKTNPKPIIMLSAHTKENAKITMEALEKGAFDFIPKPGGEVSLNLLNISEEITEKIKAAYYANLPALKEIKYTPTKFIKPMVSTFKVVVIGSSTGGPKALSYIIPKIPREFEAPIIVVQHMPEGFTTAFAERLNSISNINVKEIEDGEEIKSGNIYIAPSGFHTIVNEEQRFLLTRDKPIHGVRPAVDKTMVSAANVFLHNTIGVILTGMGKDGAIGVRRIKAVGGKVISQDEKTSVIYGMPKAAFETGCVDEVLPLEKIPEGLIRMVSGD
jgi:two-component system chemotaxis response regulator CheB|uniref:Protein-glutamate methylesterase/protein-glutamine glutaminase n=1 Tax=candidate division WOR-3 bacterium TaxID=2052148 RepID=A0A7C4Y5C9_UNCW3